MKQALYLLSTISFFLLTTTASAQSVSNAIQVSATVPVSSLWAKAMATNANIAVVQNNDQQVIVQVQMIGLDNKPMKNQQMLLEAVQYGNVIYRTSQTTDTSGKTTFVYNATTSGDTTFQFTDVTYTRKVKLAKGFSVSFVKLIDSLPLA